MHSKFDRGEFSGPYARDPHDDLGADYARDGDWSGAGRHDEYTRDPKQKKVREDREVPIGKTSE